MGFNIIAIQSLQIYARIDINKFISLTRLDINQESKKWRGRGASEPNYWRSKGPKKLCKIGVSRDFIGLLMTREILELMNSLSPPLLRFFLWHRVYHMV